MYLSTQVVVVAEAFEGKPLLQRHRMVNELLSEELAAGVHALSIVGKTPAQWSASSQVQRSPSCAGGMTKDETKREFLRKLRDELEPST